jgi:hypothetical protein
MGIWSFIVFFFFNPHLKIFFPLIFRESGRERERRKETLMCERYHQLVASHIPNQGWEPATKLCALYWNGTQESFTLQADALSTEANQLGLEFHSFKVH